MVWVHDVRYGSPDDVDQAADRFLDALSAWCEACIGAFDGQPPMDGHDQLTYTTSWSPLVQYRPSGPALAFMQRQRDAVAAHFVRTGQWRHGYWRRQEAHHGTEHFELFLGTLLRLAPNDPQTLAQLVDAAEHFGNWCDDVPPFFDWKTGRFHSTHLGTDVVSDDPRHRLNTPDHFRLVNIATLVFDATGERRYQTLAQAHAQCWADAICSSDTIPLALREDGPVYDLKQASAELIADIAKASAIGSGGGEATPVDRVENLLASGAVQALLNAGFPDAAKRLVRILSHEVADPDAAAAVMAVRDYRDGTGDTCFDDFIVDAARQQVGARPQQLAIDPEVPRPRRPDGIGKREDMPDWFEDGRPAVISPALLAYAAELADEPEWAVQACDLARTRFELATRTYPAGRHHGCSARSVSAIARGHGRSNNAGMVTAVLSPLLNWRRRR